MSLEEALQAIPNTPVRLNFCLSCPHFVKTEVPFLTVN